MNKRMIVCLCLLLSAPAGSLFARKDVWGAGIEGGLAVTAGCGMVIPVGKHLLVTLEVRDNFGVTNISARARACPAPRTIRIFSISGNRHVIKLQPLRPSYQ
jgi:hypothetical protein